MPTTTPAFTICDGCKASLVALLDERIRKILDVTKEESEEDYEIGQSHCFHLMEIKTIIEGHETCGVYDDYGRPPKDVVEPVFELVP